MKTGSIFLCTTLAASACICGGAALAGTAHASPPDVRTGHWAVTAVNRTIDAGILKAKADGLFHGDARVTRSEAAIAIAALGRALVDGKWKAAPGIKAVPDSVGGIFAKTNWKSEPVRRYAFAAALARLGDYVATGLSRPAAGAKTGASIVLPVVQITTPAANPAHDALTYLARNRMVKPGSPLLMADAVPITGSELSRGLAEMVTGANDQLTDLGKNPDGSTPDDAFHKRDSN